MIVTATQARNQLGRMLEQCQSEPVIIHKSGRRHSVPISAAQCDAILASQRGAQKTAKDAAKGFYRQYKEWVDKQNRLVEQYGIPPEQFRPW